MVLCFTWWRVDGSKRQPKWLSFATPDLPEDFKLISWNIHARACLLQYRAQQAAEAVLLAQVPQYARVNKNEIKLLMSSIKVNRNLKRSQVQNFIVRRNGQRKLSGPAICTTCVFRASGSRQTLRPVRGL
jgi:hypothetical protein